MNSHLPAAALVIWGNWLTERGEKVDFLQIVNELGNRFRIETKHFLLQEPKYEKSNDANPFFQFLERTGFSVHEYPYGQGESAVRNVMDNMVCSYLILVGNNREYMVQNILNQYAPNASYEVILISKEEGQQHPQVREHISLNRFIGRKNAKRKP